MAAPITNIETTLYTAVLSDAMDEVGLSDQVMREYLRPTHQHCTFAGWARTIQCQDVFERTPNPYEMEMEAVDSILAGEVVVVSTNKSIRNAPWGELLSNAAKARGARGAVIDGLVRDVRKTEAIGFPVFAAGIKPVDSAGRGEVIAYNVPVVCGDVAVNPGDLIFADFDGVVVVPAASVEEVLQIAMDKVSREDRSRQELARGVYLRDVFRKYGVL